MHINFKSNQEYFNEYLDIIRAFSPNVIFDVDAGNYIELSANIIEDNLEVLITSNLWKNSYSEYLLPKDFLMRKRHLKRYSKRQLYYYLSDNMDIQLPYGSLTGIRPTKLYYDLIEEGLDAEATLKHFGVSEDKLIIIKKIIATQKGIYGIDTNKYDYFVNIPFCPSRCAYCSFISETISKVQDKLSDYVKCLISDMKAVNIKDRRAIYVGGGTPTALPYKELDIILKEIKAKGEEFTVEAGRPDTINENNIAVMKDNGVNRISVNPQTFKEATLKLIGRAHSAKDTYIAYEKSKNAGFDVNMDLITMLPNESFEDFCSSVDSVIKLLPENVTVHSLSIKRGSKLKLDNYDNEDTFLATKMSDYAYNALSQAGYSPYYMYRQKNTAGRLENIGYTLSGKACVYNVDIMEETHSIYASGAGAISKIVFDKNRIERLAEVKDVYNYLERIEEMISKKVAFFNNNKLL